MIAYYISRRDVLEWFQGVQGFGVHGVSRGVVGINGFICTKGTRILLAERAIIRVACVTGIRAG